MDQLAEQYAREWANFVRTLSDEDLLRTARDYLWLAEGGPVEGRDTYSTKRDAIVAEMQERGLHAELREIRAAFGHEQGPK